MFCTWFAEEVLSTIIDNWVVCHDVPECVAILARGIVAYKNRSSNLSGFLTVCYHNKGIEILTV